MHQNYNFNEVRVQNSFSLYKKYYFEYLFKRWCLRNCFKESCSLSDDTSISWSMSTVSNTL